MMKVRALALLSVAALLLCGCSPLPMNEIPMYGGIPRSPEMQKADQEFIDQAVKIDGTREKASKAASDRAWEYYYQDDLRTAMKRFNQAWLLDTNNVAAYWGFGNIVGQRAEYADTELNLRQSIMFLETANGKSPNNARIMVDLAFSHTMLGAAVFKQQHRSGADDEFAKAQALFESAMKLEPDYPLLHYNWSVLEFYREDYLSAKTRLDEAVRLGFKPNLGYLKDINRLKEQNEKTKGK